MGEGMAYGGLPFPVTGWPVSDAGRNYYRQISNIRHT